MLALNHFGYVFPQYSDFQYKSFAGACYCVFEFIPCSICVTLFAGIRWCWLFDRESRSCSHTHLLSQRGVYQTLDCVCCVARCGSRDPQ